MNISLSQYNEIRKYEIGKLYVEIEKGEESVFDVNGFNFHFYPQNESKQKNIEKDFDQKRKAIIGVIEEKEKTNDNLQLEKSKKIMNEKTSEDDVIYFYGNNNGVLSGTNCKLFKYIAAIKNDVLYELNFMRFYISEEEKVNCILKCIQFDRVVDSGLFENRRANGNGIRYPKYSEDMDEQSLKYVLEKYEGKSFFYNPKVSYTATPEEILKSFIDFINICDNDKNGRELNA